MAIRLYRAYSPGTRTKSVSYFDDLSKVKSERTLTFGKKACGGRNNRGVITVKGRGGGHKRKYRVIDFQRKSAVSAKVATIEYDPNRNARIALLQYKDGSKRYILSPRSLRLGMEVFFWDECSN
jgi:large subunit ribosomal protein L2